jgi:4-diphosphocytidyl-2-C-methyl-D-erythritol kinase
MVFVDIADQISFEQNDSLHLHIKGSNASLLQNNWQNNIIIKAVNLLAEKYHFIPNIKITLEKNIPISAGLGGGSSNAATTLLMLNQLYQLNLSKSKLLDFGLKLGADVPFFVNGLMSISGSTTCLVSGIGEVLKPVYFNLDNLFLLIVNPNKPLSTKKVFERYDSALPQISPQISAQNSLNIEGQNIDFISPIKDRRTDLQNSAIEMMPEIATILQKISSQKNCLMARMSGSGASCFGVFDNENDLELASINLQKEHPNFYIAKSKRKS